jgi:hypothetical protein
MFDALPGLTIHAASLTIAPRERFVSRFALPAQIDLQRAERAAPTSKPLLN